MQYAVGIGLTNDCNVACAHCYRDTVNLSYMTLDQIKIICESIDFSKLDWQLAPDKVLMRARNVCTTIVC